MCRLTCFPHVRSLLDNNLCALIPVYCTLYICALFDFDLATVKLVLYSLLDYSSVVVLFSSCLFCSQILVKPCKYIRINVYPNRLSLLVLSWVTYAFILAGNILTAANLFLLYYGRFDEITDCLKCALAICIIYVIPMRTGRTDGRDVRARVVYPW